MEIETFKICPPTNEKEVQTSRALCDVDNQRRTFRLIDAFCGAGGMTLGFSDRFGHSFRSVWANDLNDYCVKSYSANFGGDCVTGDILEILNDPHTEIPQADVVIGGPPCQGFSLLNKNRLNDPRKNLWKQFFEIVKRSGAKVFCMENVPQILGSQEHLEIFGVAERLGFKVTGGILCAADYGVPQTRRRAFIIGCKSISPSEFFPPKQTHFAPSRNHKQLRISYKGVEESCNSEPWKTVRDAIENLPPPEGTEIRGISPPLDLHFGRKPTVLSLRRYKSIPKEGMNRFDLQRIAEDLTPACWIRKKTGGTDLFGRLWWDRPSFTIRTEFYKPEKGRYLHPQQHRPITHREAARLQSFPDDFIFHGNKIEIAKQIGNAVPPLLASHVAKTIYLLLKRGMD